MRPEHSPWFWLISAVMLIVFLILGFFVVPNWTKTFQTPEQRIEYLYGSIWCPICNGETIGTSQTEVSKKLRRKVRRMVREGKNNEEIFEYIESNYSHSQIAVPRNDMLDRITYGLPYLLVGFVFVILFRMVWMWVIGEKRTDETERLDPDTEKKMMKIAEELDSPLQ